MAGIQLDTERTRLRELDISLKEWGRWSSDNISAGLGLPSAQPWTKVNGRHIEDFDMQRIEEVEDGYTIWKMVTLASTRGHVRRHNLLLLFILKIHYCEVAAVPDKIHHTGRMFHTIMTRRTYYRRLDEARRKLATLIY